MTIFLDIAKRVLLEKINNEIARAKEANKGTVSSKFRDVDHSEKKIKSLDSLYVEIIALKDQNTDKVNADNLKDLIHEHKREMKKISEETGHTLGQSDTVMKETLLLIEEIHDMFKSTPLGWYNIQPEVAPGVIVHDMLKQSPSIRYRDPLDKILYYAAFYYVKKMQESSQKSWWQNWGSSLSSSTIKVGVEKSQLLENTIKALQDSLKASEDNKIHYRQSRKQSTLTSLNAILGLNTAVSQSHTIKTGIPYVSFGGIDLSLEWRCAPGDLRDIMLKALQEIQAMDIPEIVEKDKVQSAAIGDRSGEKGKELEEEAESKEEDEEQVDSDTFSLVKKAKPQKATLSAGPALFALKDKKPSNGPQEEDVALKKGDSEGKELKDAELIEVQSSQSDTLSVTVTNT